MLAASLLAVTLVSGQAAARPADPALAERSRVGKELMAAGRYAEAAAAYRELVRAIPRNAGPLVNLEPARAARALRCRGLVQPGTNLRRAGGAVVPRPPRAGRGVSAHARPRRGSTAGRGPARRGLPALPASGRARSHDARPPRRAGAHLQGDRPRRLGRGRAGEGAPPRRPGLQSRDPGLRLRGGAGPRAPPPPAPARRPPRAVLT